MTARVSILLLPCLLALSLGCGGSDASSYHQYSSVARAGDTAGESDAGRTAQPAGSASKSGVSATAIATATGQTGVEKPAVSPTSITPSQAIPVSQPLPGGVRVLIPERSFKSEGPEQAVRVSYDDLDLLKVLNMEPVTADAPGLMPGWLKQLDGKRIRIRGFMFPQFVESGIKAFALARDNQVCCFVRKPKIYDVFDVYLRAGNETKYIQNRPFDVVGVFHIRPEHESGELYQLYQIDDAVVVEK